MICIEELPPPSPGAGEVLVRVHAASVNLVDYKIRQGGFLPSDKLPMTLGRDVARVVEAAGSDIGTLAAGDAVFAMLPVDCGGNGRAWRARRALPGQAERQPA